ncbi:unnamed protein product, partial [Prorocentrum cordatum]
MEIGVGGGGVAWVQVRGRAPHPSRRARGAGDGPGESDERPPTSAVACASGPGQAGVPHAGARRVRRRPPPLRHRGGRRGGGADAAQGPARRGSGGWRLRLAAAARARAPGPRAGWARRRHAGRVQPGPQERARLARRRGPRRRRPGLGGAEGTPDTVQLRRLLWRGGAAPRGPGGAAGRRQMGGPDLGAGGGAPGRDLGYVVRVSEELGGPAQDEQEATVEYFTVGSDGSSLEPAAVFHRGSSHHEHHHGHHDEHAHSRHSKAAPADEDGPPRHRHGRAAHRHERGGRARHEDQLPQGEPERRGQTTCRV